MAESCDVVIQNFRPGVMAKEVMDMMILKKLIQKLFIAVVLDTESQDRI